MKILLSFFIIIYSLLISSSFADETSIKFVNYLNNKDWPKAIKIAKDSHKDFLVKVALSQRFFDLNCKDNNFVEIVNFLQKNPHWPQYNQLKEVAEKYLNIDLDPKLIVNWFSKNNPRTASGYKFYALASAKLEKDNIKLIQIIRNGWIYGDFTKEEEKKYLTDFSKILREMDHVKKIDEYLWKSDISEAKKYMYLVSKSYKQNFTTQITILLNKDKGALIDSLFKEIPQKYYTPSLLFHYLESKKKEVPRKDFIVLFKKVQNDKVHADKWCALQCYYAREFIDQHDWESSYKIVSTHFATGNENIREAEWLAGWLALRFLHKPDVALVHFNKFIKIVKTPLSLSRGFYWLARAYEAKHNQIQAVKFYQKASKYSYNFYGQLANLKLNHNKIIFLNTSKVTLSHKKPIKNNDIIQAIRFLIKYNNVSLGYIYAKSFIEQSSNQGEILLITNIAKNIKDPHYKLEIAKIASQHHVFIKDYLFPTPYKITNSPIELAVTYALIRQESAFNQYAISSANAMGLMQLTKGAAYSTAKLIGVKCDIEKLTKDPVYNIKLGTNHFKDFLKDYDNSLILTIASYNAGTIVKKRWLSLFGDPRKMGNIEEIIDWIELIPYYETRNYVQRILETIQVYRAIINKNNHLQLKQDMLSYAR